jgi:23S rRNA (uracil1939-C5)-methyltransferase
MSDVIRTDAMAHGGDGIARLAGKAIFVPGALPGELIEVDGLIDRGSWGRATLAGVVEPSPARIEPPCPVFAECGGCQWQHASYESQLGFKRDVVVGQLEHLGALDGPSVRPTVAPGPAYGYRNRMAFFVGNGGIGQHRPKTHTVVPTDECLLLVPPLAELFGRLGDLRGVRSITLRNGTRTGDLLTVVEGEVPEHAGSWGASVVHRTKKGLEAVVGNTTLDEIVAGVRLRITGPAFFQVNTPGADELVALVSEAIQPGPDDLLLDAYAGGGLFSVTVGRHAGQVIAVENGVEALADLRHNLATNDRSGTEVVDSAVEDFLAQPARSWDLVVCDPPRSGLGAAVVAGLVAPRPRAVAYVSCDPASFARDVRHFGEHGYRLEWAAPVDLFPQTFHIETVGLLVAE